MPYETGTATNLQDLLNKLGTFAGANGWTIHFSGARTGGAGSSGHALILSRGAVQAILRSNNSAGSTTNPGPFLEALLWSGTYTGASTETQPNPSPATNANWMTGPYVAYHFFASALAAPRPYLHVALEVQSGTFRHFGIGQLRQFGAFTNGAYVHNTNHDFATTSNQVSIADNGGHSWPFDTAGSTANVYNTIVRADFGGVSPRYCQTNSNTDAVGRLRCTFRPPSNSEWGTFAALSLAGPSAFTGRAPFFPLLCFAQADTTDNLIHPLGFPDDFRFVRVDNFAPGDSVALGADTWRIFPAVRKGPALSGPAGIQNSWTYGYAYRQVP
jgi:hypothetical protein